MKNKPNCIFLQSYTHAHTHILSHFHLHCVYNIKHTHLYCKSKHTPTSVDKLRMCLLYAHTTH